MFLLRGEPFLYYPIMVKAVGESVKLGLNVEVLTNCYWATCLDDASYYLFQIAEAGNVELVLSSDLYHGEEWVTDNVRNAVEAAKALNLKVGIIAVKCPHSEKPCPKEVGGVSGFRGANVSWEGM